MSHKPAPRYIDFTGIPPHLLKKGSPTLADVNRRLAREWSGARSLPPHVLDELAEERITGGYNVSEGNLCDKCYTYKSNNGQCNCQDNW